MNSNDILIANTDDLRSDMNYLEKTLLKGHRIDPNLYEEYDVKRGLRDSTGRGVLTGLTEVDFTIRESMSMTLSTVWKANVLDLRRQLSCSFSDVFQKKMN